MIQYFTCTLGVDTLNNMVRKMGFFERDRLVILLMEEILHHLANIKPCKQWDKLPTSTGNRRISTINSITGSFALIFHHSYSSRFFNFSGLAIFINPNLVGRFLDPRILPWNPAPSRAGYLQPDGSLGPRKTALMAQRWREALPWAPQNHEQ